MKKAALGDDDTAGHHLWMAALLLFSSITADSSSHNVIDHETAAIAASRAGEKLELYLVVKEIELLLDFFFSLSFEMSR